ncbi:FctA domain-containing protein [uncultured Psychrobacter sp.]|uniref:Spy0128 family protein n=1 Tax=uncultured Psychrobacter sp. TaxID=259303 RepID=UPI0026049463|nr:FctA domain-containing protein [uncultured Psychrobacter sp.]
MYDSNFVSREFTFELYAFDNATGDITGDCLGTATNDAEGNVAFTAFRFTEEDVGEKRYTVLEKNTGAAGITYDTTRYEVTLTITDNGIGMTEEEIEKYICQVAFSGAEEFLKQYKPEDGEKSGIIGHFGLGFYSAFMVSKKVEIDTLSCTKGAKAVHWTSEDGMEYEMEASDRTERGTTITLHIKDIINRRVQAQVCSCVIIELAIECPPRR